MIGLWFGDHGNALRYFGEYHGEGALVARDKLIILILEQCC